MWSPKIVVGSMLNPIGGTNFVRFLCFLALRYYGDVESYFAPPNQRFGLDHLCFLAYFLVDILRSQMDKSWRGDNTDIQVSQEWGKFVEASTRKLVYHLLSSFILN